MENKNEITYTYAMQKLEKLVQMMQSEDCSIDNLTQYSKEALGLLKLCKSKLLETDEELKKILQEFENSNLS